jgi:predicted ATP-dependent Lon-type protease
MKATFVVKLSGLIKFYFPEENTTKEKLDKINKVVLIKRQPTNLEISKKHLIA